MSKQQWLLQSRMNSWVCSLYVLCFSKSHNKPNYMSSFTRTWLNGNQTLSNLAEFLNYKKTPRQWWFFVTNVNNQKNDNGLCMLKEQQTLVGGTLMMSRDSITNVNLLSKVMKRILALILIIMKPWKFSQIKLQRQLIHLLHMMSLKRLLLK